MSDIFTAVKLSERTLTTIAVMICGDKDDKFGKNFMYRSSSRLTTFFTNCDQPYAHDGSTRKYWVLGVLKQLNDDVASHPELPSDSLVAVITELMDDGYFDHPDLSRVHALEDLNATLARHSLVAFLDDSGKCHLRHDGTGASSAQFPPRPRALTRDEVLQRERLANFLDAASEDEFTEIVLVPFFQRMGFHRVHAAGHKEKILEFGKDLWMKLQIPTGHWLYFCAQIKKVKIDAKGVSGGNVAEVLNQAKMAFDNEIFDPDLNKYVLLDHLFVISASDITRQAKLWLGNHLDKEQRRHLIFMDRDELLNHAARIVADLPIPSRDQTNGAPF